MAQDFSKQVSDKVTEGIESVKAFLGTGQGQDVLSIILEDHKPLKELIKIMKDSDKTLEERVQACTEFAPLLVTHAKAEEKSLYDFMKTKGELREDAFEGDTEHGIADQLLEEIPRTTDADLLGAKIKVLAEAVEHHIYEEENDMFPRIKQEVPMDVLEKLSATYIAVQTEVIANGQTDSPHEDEIKNEQSNH